MESNVYIHLPGRSEDHEYLLTAMEIAALMNWTNLTLVDTVGHTQPIPLGEQIRLIEEAERRAAGDRTLYDPLPSSGTVTVIEPLIYACSVDPSHPKHIAFGGDRAPLCQECHPPTPCTLWQPGEQEG